MTGLGYGIHSVTGNKGAGQARGKKEHLKPTHDQLYLASRINGDDDAPEGRPRQGRLTPAAIQRLNDRYGIEAVLSSLRLLRGFPPEDIVRRPYAYLESMCKEPR